MGIFFNVNYFRKWQETEIICPKQSKNNLNDQQYSTIVPYPKTKTEIAKQKKQPNNFLLGHIAHSLPSVLIIVSKSIENLLK